MLPLVTGLPNLICGFPPCLAIVGSDLLRGRQRNWSETCSGWRGVGLREGGVSAWVGGYISCGFLPSFLGLSFFCSRGLGSMRVSGTDSGFWRNAGEGHYRGGTWSRRTLALTSCMLFIRLGHAVFDNFLGQECLEDTIL